MPLFKSPTRHLLASCLLMSMTVPSYAAAQKLCVYDVVGAAGDVFNLAKDYVVAMQKLGVSLDLKAYTDERVATEDFRTGQCDAVVATGLRTRQFNQIAASIDTLGAATLVRNGKIDLPGSYDVVRKVIQTFSSPNASKLMVEGNYEVAGIVPLGAAYPVVNDRRIDSVESLAGKRMAAFDYDKAQALMIQKIGGQPVSADVTTFSTKFNNGSVDFIGAPALAYKPLELYKGIGSKGAIYRFPMLVLTSQMVINKNKFPDGFGEKSRQYWLGQYERAMGLIKNAENGIPTSTWQDLAPDNAVKYNLLLREARIELGNKGIYDKRGLNVIKRIRCSMNPSDSECSTRTEVDSK